MVGAGNTFPDPTRGNDWRDIWRSGLLAAGIALLALLAAGRFAVLQVAEHWVSDVRIAMLAPAQPASRDIVVVAITEESLAGLPYRSPVDRAFVSAVLRQVASKRPRLIAVDLLFDQPTEAAKDDELLATLRTLPVPVIVAAAEEIDGLTAQQAAFLRQFVAGIPHGIARLATNRLDDTVRSIYLGERSAGVSKPGFVSVIVAALGKPVPAANRLALSYRGRPSQRTEPFAVYPAHAIELMPSAWFAGRIVLLGTDLPHTDRHRTPLSLGAADTQTLLPGVLVYAHALAQLLEGGEGAGVTRTAEAALLLLCAVAGWLIALLQRPATLSLSIAAGFVILLWAAGFVLYQQRGPLLPLITPTITMILAFAASSVLLKRREWEQKRFLREAFGRYLSPQVINQLVADPGRLALGGERREVTCLFTDIAGFSAFTESAEPIRMVELVNAYLDGACKLVFAHRGTLDKLVGDALHVMFNAPLDQPDHAERAVRCALELDAWTQAFLRAQGQSLSAFGRTRIGVNSGSVIVGNFGGSTRFDYTAYGDAINIAARLESANSYFGTRICVSAATRNQCKSVEFRPIGRVLLKGKSEAVEVFEPLSADQPGYAPRAEYCPAYALLERDHETAGQRRSAFEALARRYPDDGLIAFHCGRLRQGASGTLIVLTEK